MDSLQPIRSFQEDMFTLIEKYLDSSQAQRDFCLENKISFAKFTYWLTKYRKTRKTSGFIPLNFTTPNIIGDTRIELPNGVTIFFNGSVNTVFIGELISKAVK